MALALQSIRRVVDGSVHLDDISLSFEPGAFNVLLGRTLAGKTSLMRVIAGLDKPTQGQVLLDGADITKLAVQKRGLSMVYQQFINYPNQTVEQNIASPLKLAKVKPQEIKRRVKHVAELMHIDMLLDRYPLELSGGQQQRCAMARALVKDAAIILFDEPLVNLDYKLREELRAELKSLFKSRDSIGIYATTEAHEALALGGNTSLLHQGKLLQHGPTMELYSKPLSLDAADLFHEPPLNRFNGSVTDHVLSFSALNLSLHQTELSQLGNGQFIFAIRPDHILTRTSGEPEIALSGTVDLAELSASETYLHLDLAGQPWVVHLTGIVPMHTQTPITVFIPIAKLFVFNQEGQAIASPQSQLLGRREDY